MDELVRYACRENAVELHVLGAGSRLGMAMPAVNTEHTKLVDQSNPVLCRSLCFGARTGFHRVSLNISKKGVYRELLVTVGRATGGIAARRTC